MVAKTLELSRCLGPVRRRIAQLASIGVGLLLLVSRAEATDVAAFLADYRAAIQQQTARRTSFEVEGVWVSEHKPQNAAPKRTVVEFSYTHNPTHEKLRSHYTELPDPAESLSEESVVVQGSERNFWLKRPDPSGAFAITMMAAPTTGSKDPISRQRAFAVNAWCNLGTYPVAKLLDSSGFRVERVEPEGDLIGVDFSYRPEDPKKRMMAGHFVVDPAQGMAIRRQDIRMWVPATPDKVGETHGEATYQMVDGIAFPAEVALRSGFPNQPPVEDTRFHATRVSTTPVPDSAFTLEAFGLGDLERPAPRSRFDVTYWAIGLAGIAFALSLFLRWRGRAGGRTAGVVG